MDAADLIGKHSAIDLPGSPAAARGYGRHVVRRLLHTPVAWVVVVALLAAGGFGVYWFAPWKLFTSKTVDDPVPVVLATNPVPGPTHSGSPAPADHVLATGSFVSHEHHTTGTVQLVALADGRRQLVLRDLSTSDGPDVWVWLSDQPVSTDRSSWSSFGTGHYLALAPLKGNRGNQVYALPAEVDLTGVHSVSLWCRRFSVSFGAAALTPA